MPYYCLQCNKLLEDRQVEDKGYVSPPGTPNPSSFDRPPRHRIAVMERPLISENFDPNATVIVTYRWHYVVRRG
jgi:hypothetical protein